MCFYIVMFFKQDFSQCDNLFLTLNHYELSCDLGIFWAEQFLGGSKSQKMGRTSGKLLFILGTNFITRACLASFLILSSGFKN